MTYSIIFIKKIIIVKNTAFILTSAFLAFAVKIGFGPF